MTGTPPTFSTFIPESLAAMLESAASDPSHRLLRGAVLYADITGSVQLAERLMTLHGMAGVGELSAVLNAAFGGLVEIVVRSGGEVVQFAGDALLAVYPADGEQVAAAVNAARSTADAMSAPGATTAGTVTVRAGVGAGEFLAVRVGGPSHRSEIVVCGPAVDEAFGALRRGSAGSAALGPIAAGALAETMVPAQSYRPPSMKPTRSVETLVPEPIRARLGAGLDPWFAELRHVTMLFVNVHGLTLSSSSAAAELQVVACGIKDAVRDHGGYFRQLSVDDKGVVAVAAFGVPPLRRERKPADALAAALQVGQSLGTLGVDASIGIATGRVFCGLIGGADRCEHTLVGSTVNLAARLMGLGGGDVCCDAVTEEESRATADFDAPQRLTLKGIPDPVEVFRLRAVREHPAGPRERAAIAGRDQEIADLIALTRTVADGGRRIVVLEGTPGLGKTTLVQAVAEAARHSGARVLMGTARWNGQAISYHAWVPIVERVLGITDVHDAVLRAARARAVLDADPELERRGTLLNDVIPLGLAPTTWSEGLDGTSRAEETRHLVTDLLLRFQGDRPLLLVLDDVQWCDPASWSVILRSLHGVPRLVLLLAARPIEDPTEEVQRFLADPRTDRRSLRTLGAEAISRSAAAAIGAATLPAGLASWLDGHAGGNPFFAREMALALVRAGSVAVEDGVVIRAPGPDMLATLALPASVEALVLRRIDALDPVQQVLLKTASVLGPTFTRLELGELHPAGSGSARIDDDLRALTAAQLLATRDDGFAFTHQIVLDATYGTMVASQLRGTHAQVARYLERAHAGDLPSVYGRLAFHWSVAREDEPTFRFLSLAATDELRKGAFREAALHLSQALALDEERGYPIALDQRARWYRQLGDAHEGLGEMPEAQHNMLRALTQFGIRLPSSGFGWKALVARELTRQLVHLVVPPRAYASGSTAWERARDTCVACMTISEVKYQENNAMGMAAMIFAAANAADRLGDSPGVARALGLAGVSFAMGRNWPLARRYFARAEAVAVRIADAAGLARCKVTEGSAYWWVGDFRKADAALTISREVAKSHGLRREFESAVGVDSNLTLTWGHFAAHRERGMQLLASSRERSRALGLIWSLLMVGKAHLLTGEFDAAEACFAEIRAQPNLLAQERVQAEGWWLALHLRRGEWTQVRRLADVVADGLGIQRGGGSPSGAIVIPMHWQPFWCHSEARVALLERASPAERPHLLRDATRAWKAHLSFGRRFDIGTVGALVHAGRTLCLGGNVGRGRRMLLRSEALAAAWEMPYDLATAHQFLALTESPGSDARRRRFDSAREGFAALPCPWELHQVELFMARETA